MPSRDENWIVKNAQVLITVAANLVIVTAFASSQAQTNIFQDVRISTLEHKVDQLSELNERIARVEETTKNMSEDTKIVKGILLNMQIKP